MKKERKDGLIVDIHKHPDYGYWAWFMYYYDRKGNKNYIHKSPNPYKLLRRSISNYDDAAYNVLNFLDEFSNKMVQNVDVEVKDIKQDKLIHSITL